MIESVLIATAGVTAALMVALWLVSLALSDVSIVDIFWGLGFVAIAWVAHAVAETPPMRGVLVCVLVSLWGARLALHLARRNVGHGEDYRYRAMREQYGGRFRWISLVTVFLLQGGLMWVISLPLQIVQVSAAVPFNALDVIGVTLWTIGFTCEAVADAQLRAFRRSASATAVMDRGLWRYSRHPNYFGDCVVWWGFGTMAVAAGAWWALAGPIVMTVLLLKVSGVSLLERTIVTRRPGYREYVERTSAFVPWRPKSRGVPQGGRSTRPSR